jgi:hypothetical protein
VYCKSTEFRLRSLGKKIKEKIKAKIPKSSKKQSHYLDPRLEDHLVKTAGILWGVRRRGLDAEHEELFERDMNFLVGRDAFDDID